MCVRAWVYVSSQAKKQLDLGGGSAVSAPPAPVAISFPLASGEDKLFTENGALQCCLVCVLACLRLSVYVIL